MSNKEEHTEKGIISESTPIRIGFIIVLLGVLFGCVWWAATITSKLDTLLSSQITYNTTISELKSKDISIDEDLSEIRLKNALLEVEVKTIKEKGVSGK